MSLRETVKLEVEVVVDVEWLAKQFAALTDDAQARFFCLVAENLGRASELQAFHVGEHLSTCECSTKAGREFIAEIARAIGVAA